MLCAFTQSRCHINLGAIQRNFQRCGAPEGLMPVIKADAYGHGILQTAQALSDVGARRFAIGVAEEGKVLREAGFTQQLVMLMPASTDKEWQLCAEYNITPVVCTFEDIQEAARLGSIENPFPVVIKLETGMHRLGFRQEQIPSLIEQIKSLPSLNPVMALSHFACADMPTRTASTKAQYVLFASMSQALKEAFPALERSLLNSAGNLSITDTPFEIARPGLTIYGGNPFYKTEESSLGEKFEWAMSLSSRILQVTELRKGECVSYGHTFCTSHRMKLAVVGAGYATAVPRILSGELEVLIRGERVPQVGRVCMGMMMVDVTAIEDIEAGEDVWLLGGPARAGVLPVTAQDWANGIGGIPYEITCSVGMMNPREYSYN